MEDENDILKRYVSKLHNNDEKITLASLKQQANKVTEDKKREGRINVKNTKNTSIIRLF